jgi:glucose/arabinose dehydrogenase
MMMQDPRYKRSFGRNAMAAGMAGLLVLAACGEAPQETEAPAEAEAPTFNDPTQANPNPDRSEGSTIPQEFLEADPLVVAAGPVALTNIDMPEGFVIREWASVEGARSLVVGDGFVLVSTQGDSVYAVPFDNKMQAGEVVTVASDLHVGNGITLVDGVLYIAEQHRVTRWGDAPLDINNPAKEGVQVGPDLPDLWHHGWRYMTTSADGKLLVGTGAPCNVCKLRPLEGSIIRIDPATGVHETIATGIRNTVGITIHPETGQPWFTDNGADMMGDDIPPEELNVLVEDGKSYGFPWYGGGRERTPQFSEETAPEGEVFPVMEFQAHSANLGLMFYTGDQFPAAYKGSVLIAQHGSWNRTFPVGYQIVQVVMGPDGMPIAQQPFAAGWLEKGDVTGRPVDVQQMPDGSVLVSDDMNGLVYRITYEGE